MHVVSLSGRGEVVLDTGWGRFLGNLFNQKLDLRPVVASPHNRSLLIAGGAARVTAPSTHTGGQQGQLHVSARVTVTMS